MAKNSTPRGGNSRIRFIVLEAEIADGDLSQVTQAIQNALRPAPFVQKVVQIADRSGTNENADSEEFDLEVLDDDVEHEVQPRKPRSSSKPRVAKTPTVLDDIDVNTNPSLKDFVADFETTTNFDKYLVIALWFRDARSVNAITVDHVYTCFRLLGWSTAINDFSKPLHNLKGEQSLRGSAKDGYTLTLTGAGKIEAKKRAS
jgi:hypothetical protein